MSKIITHHFLENLNRLIALDELKNPATIPPPTGTQGTDTFVPLIQALQVLADGFLPEINGASPEFLRSGEQPISIHLESGTSASEIELSGVIRAVAGSAEVAFEVPDNYTKIPWFSWLFSDAYSYLDDINLKPSENQGEIILRWEKEVESLEILLKFESEGTEVKGSFDFDMDRLDISIFLKPRRSAGRLLWEYAVLAVVNKKGRDVPAAMIQSSEKDLEDKLIIHRTFIEASGGGGIFNLGRDAAISLAKGLAEAVFSQLDGFAELIGNALMALPMRPVLKQDALTQGEITNALVQSFQNHSNPDIRPISLLLAIAGIPIGANQVGQLELVSGSLYQELMNSALGYQNLSRIFPLRSVKETADKFRDIFVELLEAWVRELPPDHLDDLPDWPDSTDVAIQNVATPLGLWKDELIHLLLDKTIPRFFTWLKDNTEPAHIVDRSYKIIRDRMEDGGESNPQFFIDERNLSDQRLDAVPCMRYQVNLDLIRLEPKFRPIENVGNLVLEWRLISEHGVIVEERIPDLPVKASNGSLLMNARPTGIKLSYADTNLGKKFKRIVFLEWSTRTSPLQGKLSNCHLTIEGDLKNKSTSEVLAHFETKIPVTNGTGLSFPTEVRDGNESYSSTHFEMPAMDGDEKVFSLYGSLDQIPFSSNYQWLLIDHQTLHFPVTKGSNHIPYGAKVAVSAYINGTKFAGTEVLEFGKEVKAGQTFEFGDGWSRQVIFPDSAYNKTISLRIEMVAISQEFENGSVQDEIELVLHRFTTTDGQPVFLTEDQIAQFPLQSAERIAYENGARNEWGFEMGLPYSEKLLSSGSDFFGVITRLTNKNFTPTRKPPETRKKLVEVSLPKVKVIDDGDNLSKGEVRFFLSGKSVGFISGTQEQDEIKTREFDVSSGTTLELPGPPSFSIYVEPRFGKLQVSCRGKEKDGPQWIDPDDPLGTAILELDEQSSEGIDGEYIRKGKSDDGEFDATFVIRTISQPPQARFTFQNAPEEMTMRVAAAGTPVRVEYHASWGGKLTVASRPHGQDNVPFEVEKELTALAGSFDITDSTSKVYVILNQNAEPGESDTPSRSKELTVIRA